MRFSIGLAVAVLVFIGNQAASAADIITWGTPTNISGDSDVITTGTLLYAYNFGNINVASTTVNGVTFEPFFVTDEATSKTVGNVTISESPDILYGFDVGSTNAPFSTLSNSYKDLLKMGATAGQPGTITLQLDGLSPGQPYAIQWWSSNSTYFNNWDSTTATAGNSVTLTSNTSGPPIVDGGLGQFATGTFVASGTSISIAYDGVNGWPLINGFQVRVVPEPSTWILGGIASVFMASRAYLRRRVTG